MRAAGLGELVMGMGEAMMGGKSAGSRVSANGSWLRALTMTAPIAANPYRILSLVVDAQAERIGDAPALLSDGQILSYRALAGRANQYARWALEQGVCKGETVCLLMPNRPEFMACWLGITKVGGVVSLLNTNLIGSALAHCIDIAAPKNIIIDASLVGSFIAARPHLKTNAKVSLHGDHHGDFASLEEALGQKTTGALEGVECRPPRIGELAL